MSGSFLRSCGVAFVVCGLCFAPPLAAAVPCEVRLSKLSYDDPGADDEEWLELHVVCPMSLPSTLGAAGVSELFLFNGGAAGCPVYRRIALQDVPIGPRGYSIVCRPGSELDLDVGCEQTASTSGPLGQSWLQNGPGDGFGLLDAEGQTTTAYVYGAGQAGQGACPEAIQIPEDPGPSMGDDEAVVACEQGYGIASLQQVPLRAAASCSALTQADDAEATSTLDAGLAKSNPAPSWPTGSVRHAEATHVTVPPAVPPVRSDAGAQQDAVRTPPPPDLGCRVNASSSQQFSLHWLLLLSAAAYQERRSRMLRRRR